ncbi:MAG: hypothetical protein WC030_02790 [Candidatus Paceibacterota bacterium]
MEGHQERVVPIEKFHAAPDADSLTRLVDELGPDDTFDELLSRLDENPHDAETVRQVELLLNRLEVWQARLRAKLPQN